MGILNAISRVWHKILVSVGASEALVPSDTANVRCVWKMPIRACLACVQICTPPPQDSFPLRKAACFNVSLSIATSSRVHLHSNNPSTGVSFAKGLRCCVRTGSANASYCTAGQASSPFLYVCIVMIRQIVNERVYLMKITSCLAQHNAAFFPLVLSKCFRSLAPEEYILPESHHNP